MTTTYKFHPKYRGRDIDLDKMAGGKDKDFVLTFGGATFILQYRVENAQRPGHPFLDIVVGPGDPPITVDLCDMNGEVVRHALMKPVMQILMGQVVEKP